MVDKLGSTSAHSPVNKPSAVQAGEVNILALGAESLVPFDPLRGLRWREPIPGVFNDFEAARNGF
jgi:hypothetical protein